VAASALLLLLPGTATAIPARAGASQAVEIIDFAFSPAMVTIGAGETVTWSNAGGDGSLPDVSMRAPGPSVLQLAGIGLLIASALAAALTWRSRRGR